MKLLQQKLLTKQDVDANRAAFYNTQGYPLVNHGRQYVWLALIRSRADAERAVLRAKIAEYGSQATPAYNLYSTYHAYQEAKKSPVPDQDLLQNLKESSLSSLVMALGLSSAGYKTLAVSSQPPETAFEKGFSKSFSGASSEDSARYDGIIVLASNSVNQLNNEKNKINAAFASVADITWEYGESKPVTGAFRENFGFRDGISQPVFFAIDWPYGSNRIPHWDPSASLSYVLLREPDAPAADEYGSQMAFVKIHQDKNVFDSVVQQNATLLQRSENETKSWIMGRMTDGKPLIAHGVDDNDFNFDTDPDYKACPAAAHIRKVNPRSEEGRVNRVLRRSVLYRDNDGERGLLFQCFQSKLQTGFEHIFTKWALNVHHPQRDCGPDAVLGTPDFAPRPQGVRMVTRAAPLPDRSMTQIKYGEYFYFPSIRLFERL